MVPIRRQEESYGCDRVDGGPKKQILESLSAGKQTKIEDLVCWFHCPTFSWKLTSSGRAPSIRMGIDSGSFAALVGKLSSSQRTSLWTRGYGNLLAKCMARDGLSVQAVRTRGWIAACNFEREQASKDKFIARSHAYLKRALLATMMKC